MAHYMSPDVEKACQGADGEIIDLVIVVDEDGLNTIVERAEEYGVQVEEEIEPNILLVAIEASQVKEFCRPSYIKSVSLGDDMETLDPGNLSLPLG